jgi:hypothetical protein
MAAFTMNSIICAAALAVTSIKAAALAPHPRDMTFLPRRAANESTSGWPYGPFSTDGRDIVDSNGDAVTWTGVNWPGSGTVTLFASNERFTDRLGRRDHGPRGLGVAVCRRDRRQDCKHWLQLRSLVSFLTKCENMIIANEETERTRSRWLTRYTNVRAWTSLWKLL